MLQKFQIIANNFQRNLLEYLQSDQILEVYHANFVTTAMDWLGNGVNASHYQSKVYWKAGREKLGVYSTLHLEQARSFLERHRKYGDSCIIVFRAKASDLNPIKTGETENFDNSFNPDLSHSLDRFREAIYTGRLKRDSIREIIYDNSHFSPKDFFDMKSD